MKTSALLNTMAYKFQSQEQAEEFMWRFWEKWIFKLEQGMRFYNSNLKNQMNNYFKLW